MSQPAGTAPATQPNVVYVADSDRSSSSDMLLYFVALFIPPIPVLMKRGCGVEVCINVLLWIFGWIPGVIHSWYIISKGQRVRI